MPLFNHFDFIASFYDRLITPPDPSNLYRILGLPIHGRLLDAGGGTGRISYSLRNWITAIVVVDSSLKMLARAKNKDSISTSCSNSEALPFRDETFERVIMVDALHHVIDYQVTIGELWRVVKPGGRVVIEEPDIRTFSVKIMAIAEKLLLMRSHFMPPEQIQASCHYPNARVHIEREGSTAWIVMDKEK